MSTREDTRPGGSISDAPFHATRMGRTFIEHTMPELAKAIDRLAAAIERLKPEAADDYGSDAS